MNMLDSQATERLLPYAELAESIREMLLYQTEKVRIPARLVIPLPSSGNLMVMPAADEKLAVTKIVTAHPQNRLIGLPSLQSEVVVMDASTGQRVFTLEGRTVTARRTAALSLLAARTLAPISKGSLLIVGAGVQGRSHLEAFAGGLDISRVYIASRTRRSAQELTRHAVRLGLEANVVDCAASVVDRVTFIVTATTSYEPVLPEEVPPNVFIAAVGSFRPDAAELPATLVDHSSVLVDNMEGARKEAGDLIQAVESTGFSWKKAKTLQEALSSFESACQAVIFKSVGHALFDLAAAHLAYQKWKL